jgi:hypothetical protein
MSKKLFILLLVGFSFSLIVGCGKKSIPIAPHIDQPLQPIFKVWRQQTIDGLLVRFVKVSKEDLCFYSNGITYSEIRERANLLDLDLPTEKMVVQLRKKYTDQPEGEYLLAMLQSVDDCNKFMMYHLGRYPTTEMMWISRGSESLDGLYNYDNPYKHHFIFVQRK